jgi:hypothetical protein
VCRAKREGAMAGMDGRGRKDAGAHTGLLKRDTWGAKHKKKWPLRATTFTEQSCKTLI